MKTLFSPIGTADPLTQLGDGPMLHIVRHYDPKKVVLFFSPKMLGYQQRDGRYTDAICRLCAAEGRPLPEILQVESSFEDVHRFDYYIEEFERVLKELCDSSPDQPVLVNSSSGTPAMQQALVALGSFGRLRLKLLQVPTPRRDVNTRQDREDPNAYDLDSMWAWNEDLRNEDPDASVSRVIEVATPNFADRLIRENVVSLIQSYEYKAAYELASQSQSIDEESKRMIAAARDRLNLDNRLPTKVFAKTALAYRPNDLLGEYLSVMEVRLAQGHWADFVRLLTPALTQLAKEVLRRNDLPEREYLRTDARRRLSSELNWTAINQNARLQRALNSRSRSWQGPTYITNDMLVRLVEEYCQDASAEEKIVRLRDVERNCRNRLAHELQASSKESLERLGGLSLETVLQYLFDLHGNVRPHLYSSINQAIIDHL